MLSCRCIRLVSLEVEIQIKDQDFLEKYQNILMKRRLAHAQGMFDLV